MRTSFARFFCIVAVTLCVALLANAQQSPLGAGATPEELKIYEAFRAWITSQPTDVQRADDDVVFQKYAAELRAHGKSDTEAASTNMQLVTWRDGRAANRAFVAGAGDALCNWRQP